MVMLREAVSRAVAAPVRWREVDEDTLSLWLANQVCASMQMRLQAPMSCLNSE